LTNCLWLACQINLQKQPKELLGLFSVLMIVKVLENCLQPIPAEQYARDDDDILKSVNEMKAPL